MNTIIDTDALLGIFNTKDPSHQKASDLANTLLQKGIDTFILPTTLSEFALLASGKDRIGMKETQRAIKALLNSGMPVLEITDDVTKQAVSTYLKQTSKEESLFDCYVMAAARKFGITYIFSFDKGYKKRINGFLLASDLPF